MAMIKRDVKVFLIDMKEAADLIEKTAKRLTKSGLTGDIDKRDAIIRRLEVIGEAAKGIPMSYRKSHPEIPWRDISGMRDKTIHQYFGIDYDIVWNVITKDLPVLKMNIEKLLDEEQKR